MKTEPLEAEWRALQTKESRFAASRMGAKPSVINEKLDERIPEKLRKTLNTSFNNSFHLIF